MVNIAKTAMEETGRTRRLVVLIVLHIKNAFNSARCREIVRGPRRKGVAPYLTMIIMRYREARTIIGTCEDGGEDYEDTCGVPQGSILGPNHLNLFYDDVCRQRLPRGTTVAGFVEDAGIVLEADNEEHLMGLGDRAIYIKELLDGEYRLEAGGSQVGSGGLLRQKKIRRYQFLSREPTNFPYKRY